MICKKVNGIWMYPSTRVTALGGRKDHSDTRLGMLKAIEGAGLAGEARAEHETINGSRTLVLWMSEAALEAGMKYLRTNAGKKAVIKDAARAFAAARERDERKAAKERAKEPAPAPRKNGLRYVRQPEPVQGANGGFDPASRLDAGADREDAEDDEAPGVDPTKVDARELVRIMAGETRTTSLIVARYFGKQHKHVMRDIGIITGRVETKSGDRESLGRCSEEFSRSNFGPRDYKDERGKTWPMYTMTRDGFTFLAMGFTGARAAAWKEAYIRAFNKMESELRAKPRQPGADFMAMMDTLERAVKFNLNFAGMPREQALIGANHVAKMKHGIDYLDLVGARQFVSEAQDVLLTSTYIGIKLGLSAKATNKILVKMGLMNAFRRESGRLAYRLTQKGIFCGGVYVMELVKGKVEPVQAIKWQPKVFEFLPQQRSEEPA